MPTKRILAGALVVLAAGGIAIWWSATRVERARLALFSSSAEERRAAMSFLVDRVDDDEAFGAIASWFAPLDETWLTPDIVAEMSRAFHARKSPAAGMTSLVRDVTLLQVQGRYPETRLWIDDYDNNPDVTSALLAHLDQLDDEYERWPAAADNLQKELAVRPKNAVTVDLALPYWRDHRREPALAFLQTIDSALVRERIVAAAKTANEAEDEWRLMECQVGRCTAADLPRLLRMVRAIADEHPAATIARDRYNGDGEVGRDSALDALFAGIDQPKSDPLDALEGGPQEAWRRVSAIGGGLWAERRALLSLGQVAVPALVSLYDEEADVKWSFAASTLAALDVRALSTRLQAGINRKWATAVKALIALQVVPAGDRMANRMLFETLSSPIPALSSFALDSLRLRLENEALVEGVLLYVADRERFYQEEVEAYENALKSPGPAAAAYVAATMNRLLDSAGDPRRLVWIQKVLAIHVLREIGTRDEIPVLQRLRRDPDGYVWIESVYEGKTVKEHRRNIPFIQASDDATEAIMHRHPQP